MVPISAHALFAGPMVVSPRSMLAVEFLGSSAGPNQAVKGVLWCDGRRSIDLAPGARVEVRRGAKPVRLARLRGGVNGHDLAAPFTFTDRLVAKFGLPVSGWRGRRDWGSGRDGKEDPPTDA
jgi:NAD+ kinase